MSLCLSGGNDADDLYAVVVVPCMCDQHEPNAIHHTNCLPPQLAILDPLYVGNTSRVGEYADGIFKGNAMFVQVRRSLGRIPLKEHVVAHL
jgi:hypothetical protein